MRGSGYGSLSCIEAQDHVCNGKSKRQICHNVDCLTILPKDQKNLVCSRCRFIHYCSEECQKKDWKNHKQSSCFDRENFTYVDAGKIEALQFTCHVNDKKGCHGHGLIPKNFANLENSNGYILSAIIETYGGLCGCGFDLLKGTTHYTSCNYNSTQKVVTSITKCREKCNKPRKFVWLPVSTKSKYLMMISPIDYPGRFFALPITMTSVPILLNVDFKCKYNGSYVVLSYVDSADKLEYIYEEKTNSWILKK